MKAKETRWLKIHTPSHYEVHDKSANLYGFIDPTPPPFGPNRSDGSTATSASTKRDAYSSGVADTYTTNASCTSVQKNVWKGTSTKRSSKT